jgi:hypothetical protein
MIGYRKLIPMTLSKWCLQEKGAMHGKAVTNDER